MLALVAQEPERRRIEHGREQRVCGELGNAVGQTHGEPRNALAARFAHFVEQRFADLKDLLRAIEGRLAGFRHDDAAPCGFQQLAPDRFFQFAHLGADGLHGHVEALGRTREATFLYDDPEIVKMAVVQHGRRHFEENDMSSSLSLSYSHSWSRSPIQRLSRPESPTPAVRISGKLDG
jgi:hypothetical protein